MIPIKLEFPVLVQQVETDHKMFLLRPAFLGFPTVQARRFEEALQMLKGEVKGIFKSFRLSRSNLDFFLWFQFNPKLDYRTEGFDLHLGKQYISGNFSSLHFRLKDLHFVCLPSFDHYMFIAPSTHQAEVREHTRAVLLSLFKDRRKQAGGTMDVTPFYAAKREFITSIQLKVVIKADSFHFPGQQAERHYSSFRNSIDFQGVEELEKVGYELDEKYPNQLTRAYYQDEMAARLYEIIYNSETTPLVLVGAAGVGKKTLLEEIVWQYCDHHQEQPDSKMKKTWVVDPTRIISGMSIVGMWQKRFETILQYIIKPGEISTPSYHLIIDNPVALLRIGQSAQNKMTLGDVLKPYLEQRKLQLILLATPEEWQVVQERDRRFSDLFQVVRVSEPDLETAAKIVLRKRQFIERVHGCEITILALDQLFNIQRNYLRHKALPGSIIQLLEQLGTKYSNDIIDAAEVRNEFEILSGINEKIFDVTLPFKPDEVRAAIARQLIGQEEAIEALTNVVHMIKAKLYDPGKPMGSLLFVGPTGVGKTHAAKTLCAYLLGSEKHLLRFDMNEYIDEEAVQRLIGDYYNPEGQLSGKVRYQPFSVILLDEIEKAHPKVHDLLLQVLDDGRLTDSLGRTVDFSNTVLIMSSNVGAQAVTSRLGFETASTDDTDIYRKAVELQFRPEFINRIDQIVIFQALKLDHILSIARLQIRELLQRDGFVRRTTILNISTEALRWVAQRGFDAKMGGRALRRQIERDLTTLSAEQLVSTDIQSPIIFEISYRNGTLIPNITPLEFTLPLPAGWLPKLPDETKGKGFYGQLLRIVESIEYQVSRMETEQEELIVVGERGGDQLNWQYYDFKDRITEIKQRIQTLMLGFRDKYFIEAPAVPLRLKGSGLSSFNWMKPGSRGYRETLRDRLFQQEALEEISEAYRYGSAEFDSMQTEFIDNYINVAMLKLSSSAFLKAKTDKIYLHFQSCINALGEEEIEFLMQLYSDWLTAMDFAFRPDKKGSQIEVEGHAVYQMLKPEAGIHLFYKAHQNPLPIYMTVQFDAVPKNYGGVLKVIRLYDRNSTLTDLRSGFSNAANITPREFKLLIFAGLVEENKVSLPISGKAKKP